MRDLDGGQASNSASVLLVTIWELGEAAGPFVMAPASEVLGRAPVLNAANACFVGAVVLAALARSSALLIAARFLTGLAVASNVLNPAIIGDLFPPARRGSPMSLVSVAPLLGGAVGPAISGALAEWRGWRSVLWLAALLAVACAVLLFTCLRETYKVPILRRRAARLRQETGNAALTTAFEMDGADAATGRSALWDSALRPMVVFASSGVLQTMSLFGSVLYTVFYIFSTSLPGILQENYHLTPAQIGASFVSFSIGSLMSVVACNGLLDRAYARLSTRNKGVGQPEFRLPFVLVGGLLLPLGLALYGWIAQERVHVGLLLLSVGFMGSMLMFGILPLMTYVVDAFGLYSASAMTVLIVTRCLASTFLPLATAPLTESLGYGWGFTVQAAVVLALVPIPILVLRYGARWRQRSVYTRDQARST